MKKIIVLVISLLALASIGFGQARTVKQQEARNASAKWLQTGESNDGSGDAVYMNVADIGKVATLAIFDVKMLKNGLTIYTTLAVNCLSRGYIGTNTFVQATPTGKLLRMEMYDMKHPVEIEKDSVVGDMADYACRNGVEIK